MPRVRLPEWTRFKKVWETSLQIGVQKDLVWSLVEKYRPIVLEMPTPTLYWYSEWVPRIKPHEYFQLLASEDFTKIATTIFEQDAGWHVWAHDTHTRNYINYKMATAHVRMHRRMRLMAEAQASQR